MPEISVIMPVYNTKEEFFREAIQSVLNQTFEDFEFVIVNDGSTDKNVEAVVKSYTDKRIKYFYKENGGAASARNFAIKQATGKYLAFLDSDDAAYPERLAKQYAFLENNREIGCLGTKVDCYTDETNKKINFPDLTMHDAIQLHLLFVGCVFCQSSVMLRKDVLDKNSITYRDEFIPSEDYAFYLDLVGNTKFAVLDEVLGLYRFYEGNISTREREKQGQCALKAQISAWGRFCNYKDFDVSVWTKFCLCEQLNIEELDKLVKQFDIVKSGFVALGCLERDVLHFFSKRLKKHYYKTKSFLEQIRLWKSPLNKLCCIPLSFRLYCLIARGVL